MTIEIVKFERHWQRRDTAANWTSVNPILASGEWGVEIDLSGATARKFKLGDGVTAWTSLPYSNPAAFIVQTITNGDTSHAPSGDVVFDALALKADTSYVDALVAGLSWKQAVRAATIVAGTLATSFESGDTIDGVVLATGDRILVKNQATTADNGIYTVNTSGAPTRALDANSGAELVNASVYVSEGTTLADTQWTCTTNAPITVGSTSLTFGQLATGGGPTPSGAGFRHVTAGVEDGAAKLVDTADINAAQVTNPKLANMGASTIKARKTTGAGDPEDCTLSEVLDLIGAAAHGDILYRGASAWARLGPGASGYLLKSNGVGANPSYVAPAAASVGVGAQIGFAYVQSSTAASTTDTSIPADDTIPQSSEGVAYASLDVSITPADAASLLVVEFSIPFASANTSGTPRFALFRDSAANAIRSGFSQTITAGTVGGIVRLRAIVVAGSTALTTFKLRWCSSAGTSYLMRDQFVTSYFSTSDFATSTIAEIKQ